MADATLYDIDAALFAQLSTLLTDVTTGPTAVKPFACVGRHAGPVSQASLAHVAAQFPCALLRRDDEASVRDVRTTLAQVEDRAAESWSVIVAVEDPRDIDAGIQGNSTVPGLNRLVDIVKATLNGLAIPGLWNDQPVRYAGVAHELIDLGVVYCDAVRFDTWTIVPQFTNPDVTVPLVEVDGDINLEDTGAGNPENPAVQFVADIT